MIIEENCKLKFELVRPWIYKIMGEIKKEIKSDHLFKEPVFAQKYFAKRSFDRLSLEEISSAYLKEIIEEGNEVVGEWVVSRWVFRHAEIYHFFAESLSVINPQFDEIDQIPSDTADSMLEIAVDKFGALNTYIFCVLNTVKIESSLYERLRMLAEKDRLGDNFSSEEQKNTETSLEELRAQYEQKINKLIDKYEKRILGLMRKYAIDVEGLRKQISQLQKKIGGKI